MAGILPVGTPGEATRAGISAGFTLGSESTLARMRNSKRPLLRLRPIRRLTCPRPASCHSDRGFRQRFFGLRRYSHPTPAAEFLSFLLMCAPIITSSSATASRVLLRPDASSTARPRSASSNHFCRCSPSPVTSIFLIQASIWGGTHLTSATDLKNSRNRKCPRARPLSIHRMTMQHTGIPHCVPEPDSGQQPKTESLARESSCWC